MSRNIHPRIVLFPFLPSVPSHKFVGLESRRSARRKCSKSIEPRCRIPPDGRSRCPMLISCATQRFGSVVLLARCLLLSALILPSTEARSEGCPTAKDGIATDRPDVTNSSLVVPTGSLQNENGVNFSMGTPGRQNRPHKLNFLAQKQRAGRTQRRNRHGLAPGHFNPRRTADHGALAI